MPRGWSPTLDATTQTEDWHQTMSDEARNAYDGDDGYDDTPTMAELGEEYDIGHLITLTPEEIAALGEPPF